MDIQTPAASDRLIAQKMRTTNYEQFKSLVRMHLSFELDLNTDEFDLPCHEVVYYEKGKVKRWNRLSKKMKGCTAGAKTNSPPEETSVSLTLELIKQLRVLKAFLLLSENVIQEGIFRRTGAVSRQNELRSLLNQRKELNLCEGYTVHDCATVYKGCLSELPEPLLTDAHYPAHCQIADLCNADDKSTTKIKEEHLLHSVQLLLLLLPDENRVLLEDVIDMLHETVKYERSNKMTADSLATLFTPHLICPRNLPAEALHYVSQSMSSVISYMIAKGPHIFEIPPKLATDIRAYSLEQKRKKTMSPEQILDESISDVSTVNTVYTFVDREKTAEAHNSNPTDTALAQLYAHIQSMPESSKKRKLIKQFNKENGQGTPLQFLMLNRIKNAGSGRSAKSIGDSIKKHIFQRSIMSRTPKRSAPTPQCDTPNSAISAPKVRVLFQSPNPNANTFVSSFAAKRHPLHKSISSSSLLTSTVISTAPSPIVKLSNAVQTEWQPPEKHSAAEIEDSTKQQEEISCIKHDEVQEALSSSGSLEENSQCNQSSDNQQDNVLSRRSLLKRKSESDVTGTLHGSRDDIQTRNRTTLRKSVSLNNMHARSLQARRILDCQDMMSSPAFREGMSCGLNRGSNSAAAFIEAENTPRALHNYRSKELITSTPSLLFGRKSMSPITKSTQRMPKSMQESIMTPRSRKPVMLAANVGLLDQNQPLYEGNLSSFPEQDEDIFLDHNTSTQVEPSILYQSFNETELNTDMQPRFDSVTKGVSTSDSLTNTFREYLLGRSVLTASPVDTSFSSHSDDFVSTPDIRDLNESEMSASLLYCLDGNQPDSSLSDASSSQDYAVNRSELTQDSFDGSGISRKRSASSDELFDEKENHQPNGNYYAQPKKVFVLDSNPNETSL